MMDVNVSELKLAAAEELESEFREGGGHLQVFPMRDQKMFELDLLILWCLFQMELLDVD